MRNSFCNALLEHSSHSDFVFLTGDLGYAALEPLASALGDRFINCGVAEQNMVGVAAGMAREGLYPWLYSIGPFLYARAYEQIRNDLAMNGFPAVIVGNGGGYGYGVMGATHHSLEDCALMSTLEGFRVYIPSFDSDLSQIVRQLFAYEQPAYLRLGREELKDGMLAPTKFAPWRKVLAGNDTIILSLGPLVGSLWGDFLSLDPDLRPTLWVNSLLPVVRSELPEQLLLEIANAKSVIVAEEHVAEGGLASQLCRELMLLDVPVRRFHHFFAQRYPTQSYGSQRFHRVESKLTGACIAACIREIHDV